MYGYGKKYYIVIFAVILFIMVPSALAGQTWKLQENQDLQLVSDTPQDQFALEINYLKSIVDKGKADLISDQVNKIRKKYPKLVGKDLDAFAKGELAYAENDYPKAVREYDSFMKTYPQSQFVNAALEREFTIGQAYLNGHKKTVLKVFKIKGYAEGEKVMDKVIEKAGNIPLAVKALTAIAESLEERGKYADAYDRWSQMSSMWPTGETGKTALLSMARCKHAAYRGPDYDVSDLVSAKSYYENFAKRYPEDAKKYEIEKRLAQITEQLAYKEYTIAEYYHRTGSDESSDMYCDQVLETWPDTTSAQRVTKIAEEIENKPVIEEPKKENKWSLKNLIMP
jgi:outer membrane protein assembly factor BamD